MKTTFNKYMIGALALVSAALAGCSNEESLLKGGNSGGESLIQVPVSIGVTVGEDNATRTILAEENDVMTWKWEKGDQIVVYTFAERDEVVTAENSKFLGYLTAEDPTDDGKKAVFKGILDFTEAEYASGSSNVRLWYLGKDVDVTNDDSSFKKIIDLNGYSTKFKYEVPLSNQEGTEESLAKRDLLRSGEVEITIGADGIGTNKEDVTMTHELATACFKLIDDNGQPYASKKVTVSGKNFVGNYSVGLAGGTSYKNGGDSFNTIYSQTTADGLLYLNLPAMSGVVADNTIDIRFTITSEDQSTYYVGTLENISGIQPGVYYKAKYGNEWNPIEIELTYPNDTQAKNPLRKWAKTDLVCISSGYSALSKFQDSAFEAGSYYQFGRNIGFANENEAQLNYYIDNNYNKNGNVYRGLMNNSTPVERYSNTQITDPNAFYISNSLNGDYLKITTEQTWQERASYLGYDYTIPYNDNTWTIPTAKDFYEIMPEFTEGAHGYMGTEIWSGIYQIKPIDDDTNAAFCWYIGVPEQNSYNNIGLYIECKVFNKSENITLDDIKQDSFWENEEDHEILFFRASGRILASTDIYTDSYMGQSNGTHYIASPLDWGKYIIQRYMNQTQTAYYVQQASYMAEGGFYWTRDKEQKAFAFYINNNNNTGFSDGLYFAKFTENPDACNIRLIKKSQSN